ncbi:MAG: hypothetical protein BGO78_03600 [Chloroflexi bacterium 44-23]|nr:MAG: hypothetical protein BGO78_03600 [Chloroflexi bacterium 44-23]
MKFGLILPNYGPAASRLSIIDAAQRAESLGFDSIWLTDHLALPQADSERFGHIYESLSTSAYLAAGTNTIKLGISSLVLPQRNPVEVAKAVATIDDLSGGRTMLAAGIGWSAGEYNNLGYSFSDRAKRMNEAVQVLRVLWQGQPAVSFSGNYYSFKDLVLSPAPIQNGGPPLWLAGDSIYAARRAALLADGWHPNASSPQTISSKLDQIKSILSNRPFTIAIRFRLDFKFSEDDSGGLYGSPSKVIQKLKDYRAIGMNYALINFIAESNAQRGQQMKIFINEVAPAFL